MGPGQRGAEQFTGEQASGALEEADLRTAVAELESLARFYGNIAARDSNSFASTRWAELQGNYRALAERLRALLDAGRLRIADLPDGALRVSPDGLVEIDVRLDGQWLPSLVRFSRLREQGGASNSDQLLPIMIEALAQAEPSADWRWFDDHVRRSGTLAPVAQQTASRADLARYFFLKDSYLSLSMQRIAEGDPGLRHAWARRQMRAFTEVRSLRRGFAGRFGSGPAELLRQDWSNYVALVDGFAVTRGWLMLDPTLRLTQAAEPPPPGTIRQAADEIVSAQQSSIMALRDGQRSPGISSTPLAGAAGESAMIGPSLAALVEGADRLAAQQALGGEVAASIPLQALMLRPEIRSSQSDSAEFRAFAARLKEVLEQPDPSVELARREEALEAAEEQLRALEARVNELEPVEEEVATLQERVEVLRGAEEQVAVLEEEVAGLREAEQQVAELQEQVGALDEAQDEVAALRAQVENLDTALDVRDEQTAMLQEQLAEAQRDPASAIAPAVTRIEQRQLYMMAAIGVMFILTVIVWLWRRDRQVVIYEERPAPRQVAPPPKLLTGPMSGAPVSGAPVSGAPVSGEQVSGAAASGRSPLAEAPSPPDVIDVGPEEGHGDDVEVAAPANGADVGPPEARLAGAGEDHLRMAAAAVQAAALGDEERIADHPIVRALRKGNLPLFELLFAELTELRSPQLQRIVYGGGGEDLAIACRAVGVDKLLFGAIFLLTDHLRGGDADTDPERVAAILSVYDRTAPETAKRALLKWQRNWGTETVDEPSLAD
ncbi:DUF2336 domain-containing protein [Pelagibius sp.]|uniref:DUF2336 domain-containing protein n=1 Tax=Pelagibius sp. TaxID=1931238 RepID=UPI00261CBCA4|nr:DUF2336 domain-containing protein [Pelagibius sp.]